MREMEEQRRVRIRMLQYTTLEGIPLEEPTRASFLDLAYRSDTYGGKTAMLQSNARPVCHIETARQSIEGEDRLLCISGNVLPDSPTHRGGATPR